MAEVLEGLLQLIIIINDYSKDVVQTPFRVSDDPEINQLDAKYDPELGQSDPIICQFD